MRSGLQWLPVRTKPLRIFRVATWGLRCPANFAHVLGVAQAGYRGLLVVGGKKSSEFALSTREDGHEVSSSCSRSQISPGNGSAHVKGQHELNSGWKSRLVSFEQYQHESNLGDIFHKGFRLVDHPTYSTDFDLWLELIRFRRRQSDIEGTAAIWREIQSRKIRLPLQGTNTDEVWDQFIQFGWDTSSIRQNVIIYAQRLRSDTGQAWGRLYFKIISDCLEKPRTAFSMHKRLHHEFPPTSEQLKQLFYRAVSSTPAFAAFKGLYKDLKIRDMYDTIIPHLCRTKNYAHAIKWHHLMMRMNDHPSSSSAAEPLIHHLAIYADINYALTLVKAMVDAGVALPPISTKRNDKAFLSREIMNRHLGETHGIAPKVISDEFCARLFATTMFSVDTIISGLRFLGVANIGPLALRELMLREGPSPSICRRRIDQLSNVGIGLDDSTFCMLVDSLASRGERQLLEDVVRCDMHSDAFEDEELQEALLMSYRLTGDHRQADRTLAILTARSSLDNKAIVYWNVLLRSALKRQDKDNSYQILEKMRELHIPVSAKTSNYVSTYLLSERRTSRRPTNIQDLPAVIAICQRILRTGGVLPPSAWTEILRRLGMMGHLIEFEKLALWLADWYSNPTERALQLSLFSQKKIDAIPKNLPTNHPRHPLHIIFPAVAQQAIVAWGFQHVGDIEQRVTKLRKKGLTWRWGLELLAKLKQRNVTVIWSTVSKACRLRLIALFGKGSSNRKVNRRVRLHNQVYQLEYYANEMERLWGKELFRIDESWPRDDTMRMLKLKQMVMGKPALSCKKAPFLESPADQDEHRKG